MKTYKKIALTLTILLSGLGVGLVSPSLSYAATGTTEKADDIQKCMASLQLVDVAHIHCTDDHKRTIVFLDSVPDDQTANFVPEDSNAFCSADLSKIKNFKENSYKQLNDYGINMLFTGDNQYIYNVGIGNLDGFTGSTPGFINLGWDSGSGCTDYTSGSASSSAAPAAVVSLSGFRFLLQWNSDGSNNITSLNGVSSDSSTLGGYNFKRLSDKTLDPSNGHLLYESNADAGACTGSLLAYNASQAWEYTLTSDTGSGDAASGIDDLKNAFSGSNCNVKYTNFGLYDNQGALEIPYFFVSGTASTAAGTGQIASSSTLGAGSSDTCEINSNAFTLAWLMCPALEASDAFATELMNIFESQLPFTVPATPGGSTASVAVSCGKTAKGATASGCGQNLDGGLLQVHNTWSILREIASGIIVIVMLIMVVSQAIGGGPFEAYTIRKVLPKLAIATILIQVSWPIAAYVINLVNDIGRGLSDLMYLPFGGESSLDFGSLLANAKIGTGEAFFMSSLITVGAVLALAALPAILAAATGAVIGLIFGLGVLVFRKILIIMLLITSPLAIIAWVFPSQGMQKYWKMWQDNFLKSLFMYPLVVLTIAGGRIFADVVGKQNNSTFLNFVFIMVGYFGPLFIIFKAYKWGGSLMGSAANAANGFSKAISGVAKPGVKQWANNWYTGKRANMYEPDASNFGVQLRDKNGKLLKKNLPLGLGQRPTFKFNGKFWRSVQGGRLMPTARGRGALKARGKKWSGEMAELKDADIDNVSRSHELKGLSPEEIQEHLDQVRQLSARDEYDHFTAEQAEHGMEGVAAGKWSLQMLALEAFMGGDGEMLKAIARYHIEHGSLLEMASGRFRMPEGWETIEELNPETGEMEKRKVIKWVPFLDWSVAQDQAYKDSALWRALSGMRGNFPPNNWPRGGAAYKPILAEAGFAFLANGRRNTSYDPTAHHDTEMFEALGGELIEETDAEGRTVHRIPTLAEQEAALAAGDKSHLPKNIYYAQKIQDIREALGHDLAHGGNAAASTMNEAHEIFEGRWHHPGQATPYVVEEMVRDILLAGDEESGQQEIKVIGNASHAKIFNTLLDDLRTPTERDEATGKPVGPARRVFFRDVIGQVHEVTDAKQVLRIASSALQRRQGLLSKYGEAPDPGDAHHRLIVLEEGEEPPESLPLPEEADEEEASESPGIYVPPGVVSPRSGVTASSSRGGASGRAGRGPGGPRFMPTLDGPAGSGASQAEYEAWKASQAPVTLVEGDSGTIDIRAPEPAQQAASPQSPRIRTAYEKIRARQAAAGIQPVTQQPIDVEIDGPAPPGPVGKQDVEMHYGPGSESMGYPREHNALSMEIDPESGDRRSTARDSVRVVQSADSGSNPSRLVIDNKNVTAKEITAARTVAQAESQAVAGLADSSNVVNAPSNFSQFDRRAKVVQQAAKDGTEPGEWAELRQQGSRSKNSPRFQELPLRQQEHALRNSSQSRQSNPVTTEAPIPIQQVATSSPGALPTAPPLPPTNLDKVETKMNNVMRSYQQAQQRNDAAAMNRLTQRFAQLQGQRNQLLSTKAPGWDTPSLTSTSRTDLSNELAALGSTLVTRPGTSLEAVAPTTKVELPKPDAATVQALYSNLPKSEQQDGDQYAAREEWQREHAADFRSKIMPQLSSTPTQPAQVPAASTAAPESSTPEPAPQIHIGDAASGSRPNLQERLAQFKAEKRKIIHQKVRNEGHDTSLDNNLFWDESLPAIRKEAAKEAVSKNVTSSGFSEFNRTVEAVKKAAKVAAAANAIGSTGGSGSSGGGSGSGGGNHNNDHEGDSSSYPHHSSDDDKSSGKELSALEAVAASSGGGGKGNVTNIINNITKASDTPHENKTTQEVKPATTGEPSSYGGLGQIQFDRLTRTLADNTAANLKVAKELRKKGKETTAPGFMSPGEVIKPDEIAGSSEERH